MKGGKICEKGQEQLVWSKISSIKTLLTRRLQAAWHNTARRGRSGGRL